MRLTDVIGVETLLRLPRTLITGLERNVIFR